MYVDECDWRRLLQSDESFLEASGILDSIHQVMKDFIVTSTPEKQPDQIIISDDVIAEIRQGIERKDAEEARRLRQLRSLSDFNDSSTAMCVFELAPWRPCTAGIEQY